MNIISKQKSFQTNLLSFIKEKILLILEPERYNCIHLLYKRLIQISTATPCVVSTLSNTGVNLNTKSEVSPEHHQLLPSKQTPIKPLVLMSTDVT